MSKNFKIWIICGSIVYFSSFLYSFLPYSLPHFLPAFLPSFLFSFYYLIPFSWCTCYINIIRDEKYRGYRWCYLSSEKISFSLRRYLPRGRSPNPIKNWDDSMLGFGFYRPGLFWFALIPGICSSLLSAEILGCLLALEFNFCLPWYCETPGTSA